MIEETARVVRIESGHAWVETERRGACGSCASRTGCGTSTLADWFGRRTVSLRVGNGIGAQVGEQVVIGLPEAVLVAGAAWLYGLPLLTLLLGAGLGAAWSGDAHDDLATALGGLLGLWFGFALARRRHRVGAAAAQARILRRQHRFVILPE